MGERFGFLPGSLESTGTGAIWLHAVSVGEILSSVELLKQMRQQHPSVELFVSTSTLAGRVTAEQKLINLADGVFFAPLDYRSAVRRVLRRLRPSLVVVLETEIWPNLYREAKRAGAALAIVNGRISDRAFPRYRAWARLFRHVLIWPDAIITQSEKDAKRFAEAGAPVERIQATGNLKYDFTPSSTGIAAEVAAFLDRVQPKEIWIAASTMPPNEPGDVDEDDAVIAAFAQLSASRPKLLLILAPRKPEQFDVVGEKLARAGVPYIRRTALNAEATVFLPGILLLNTIGELAALFELADVVFMGGTLAERGGHNILEPAYFGKPIIAGPHMENFAAMAADFDQAGAIRRIDEPRALGRAVLDLLIDPRKAAMFGGRARELAVAKRGVAADIAQKLWALYGEGVPNPRRTILGRLGLAPLSWMWREGLRLDLRRKTARQRKLHARVVSVGGLSMGGVGKSPVVAHLAARLRESGANPAILTRGYKRKSSEAVVVKRGESASVEATGDEAQTFVRAGQAHVGIGKNRYEVGRRMEAEVSPRVVLLDDGFQHAALKRDEDIVLVDALDPVGGGVFPLGRLREPMSALKRATAVIVTRTEEGMPTAGIEKLVRRFNSVAPIFRSRVRPESWVGLGGERHGVAEAPFQRVGAFCGLGNPAAFWKTLAEMEVELAFRESFADHHAYRAAELERLAQRARAEGAQALVTTEKDAMNLCDGAEAAVRPLKLYWLKAGIEIENEEELMRRIWPV